MLCFVAGDIIQFLHICDVYAIDHCSPKAAVQDAFKSLGLKDYYPESVTQLYFERRISFEELKRLGPVGCYFAHATGVREGYITGPAPPALPYDPLRFGGEGYERVWCGVRGSGRYATVAA